MKAQKVRMSTHATEDRLDRLTYIAMTIGFGDTAYTFPDTSHKDRYFAFTGFTYCVANSNIYYNGKYTQ